MTRTRDKLYSPRGWKKAFIARLADRIDAAKRHSEVAADLRPPRKRRRGGQKRNTNAAHAHERAMANEAVHRQMLVNAREVEKLSRLVAEAERLEREGASKEEIRERIRRLSTALGLPQGEPERTDALSPPEGARLEIENE